MLLLAALVILGVISTVGSARGQRPGTSKPAIFKEPNSIGRIGDYWTPTRLRHAKPLALPASRSKKGIAKHGSRRPPRHKAIKTKGTRTRIPGARQRRSVTASDEAITSFDGVELPWKIRSYGLTKPLPGVGRLFFRLPEGDPSFCTGTLVAPSVIVTAAHCVVYETRDQGGQLRWFDHFNFVPEVYGDKQPCDGYAGKDVFIWPGYVDLPGPGGQPGYSALDYAFIVLQPNSAGQDASKCTQYWGVWANAPKGDVLHVGYPGEGEWRTCKVVKCKPCTNDSCYPWQCTAPIQRYFTYPSGGRDVGISCRTSGGASGGPWFEQSADGKWYVASVLSHGPSHFFDPGDANHDGDRKRYSRTVFGAYFDDYAIRLFDQAKTPG